MWPNEQLGSSGEGAGWGGFGGPLKATEGPVVFAMYLLLAKALPWQVATRAGDGQRAMEGTLSWN